MPSLEKYLFESLSDDRLLISKRPARALNVMHFATLEEMNEHQLDAQVQEAMRVKVMSGGERARWLEENWDPLQRQFSQLCAGLDVDVTPRAIHFATVEAKNAYDEEQELQLALAIRTKLGL
jgi:hypothetical protein